MIIEHDNNAKLLTETMVAERYSLGLRQLRSMRMRGTGPAYLKVSGQIGRSGGRVLYRIEAVESWLASRPSGGERITTPETVWPPHAETR